VKHRTQLKHFVYCQKYFVDFINGQWITFGDQLMRNSKPRLRPRRAELVIPLEPLCLVFRDQQSLDLFLATDDPTLKWMVEYTKLVQSFDSPLVATVAEVDELLVESGIEFFQVEGPALEGIPEWVHREYNSEMDWITGLERSNLYSVLTHFSEFNAQEVLQNDFDTFYLARSLSLKRQLLAILRGEQEPDQEIFEELDNYDEAMAAWSSLLMLRLTAVRFSPTKKKTWVVYDRPLFYAQTTKLKELKPLEAPLDVLGAQ